MEERLQKILARAGFGSRRANEELISAGRVRVNGEVAKLGSKADPMRDRIEVDGRPIELAEPLVYVALYKPRGVISAVKSPDPRPTVRDLVPVPGNIYPVGRLDVDSEGLILLTNDGELANRLTHPRYGHKKEYQVLVARRPDEEQLATWRRGVVLEDGYKTAPAEVRFESVFGKGAWLRVILREGRKRQIRETGSLIGLPVVRIIRVRIGSLHLGNLKPREWRHLSQAEVAALKGQDKKVGPKPKTARRKPPESRPKTSRQKPQTAGSRTAESRPKPKGRNSRSKKSGESSQSRRPPEKGRRR
jgi:23S rRNA pseudouridine2605 synthase